MFNHILVRYGEINTKGQNRPQLERLLMKNVQDALKDWDGIKVNRISSRILVKLKDAPVEPVLHRLQKVFGISSISPVAAAKLDVDDITDTAVRVAKHGESGANSFKVEVKRGNKQFVMTSPELTQHVGAKLTEEFPHLRVDVHHPDMVVHIDVRDEGAFVYAQKIEGAGGFPVGMSGRTAALLSGGIDSPVAIWKAQRRGMHTELVHFHSFPFTSERAQRKVEQLAAALADWSRPLNLHLISLTETQAAIQKHCPEALRTILLRRMMFRIATALGKKRRWLSIVTGDSLGQVASQTLEGLYVVDNATDLTVLRPLITEDKVDIIRQARAVGTYEISIQPYDDCCSLFAPRRPKTHPRLDEVLEAETRLDIEALVEQAVQSVEIKLISPAGRSTAAKA